VTAREIYDFVIDAGKKNPKYARAVPVIVLIDHWDRLSCRNCPSDARLFCPAFGYDGPAAPRTVESFANELLSPLRAVLAARDARGRQAIGDADSGDANVVELRLAPRHPDDTKLPLGWMLSDQSMDAIDDGVERQHGNKAAIAALKKFIETGDKSALGQPADCARTDCGGTDAKGSSYGGGQ